MKSEIDKLKEDYLKENKINIWTSKDSDYISRYLNDLVDRYETIQINEFKRLVSKPLEVLYNLKPKDHYSRMGCIGVKLTPDISIGVLVPLERTRQYKDYIHGIKQLIKEISKDPSKVKKEKTESLLYFFMRPCDLEASLSENLTKEAMNKFLLYECFPRNNNIHLFDSEDKRYQRGNIMKGSGFRISYWNHKINNLEDLTEQKISEDFYIGFYLLKETVNGFLNAFKDPAVRELFEKYNNLEKDIKNYSKLASNAIRRANASVSKISKLESPLRSLPLDPKERKFFPGKEPYMEEFLRPAVNIASSINDDETRIIKHSVNKAREYEIKRNKLHIEKIKIKEQIRSYLSKETKLE